MCVAQRLTLLGLVLVFASACATTRPKHAGSSGDARGKAHTLDLSFDVRAPYTATLLNTLEGASLDWLNQTLGFSSNDLDWIKRYRQARQGWTSSPYFGHVDASFVPHLRCGYRANNVNAMLKCMRRVTPSSDHHIITQAIARTDTHLRTHWQRSQPFLNKLRRLTEGHLQNTNIHALIGRIAQFAQLKPKTSQRVSIVMALRPPQGARLGRREDNHLIVEVDRDQSDISVMSTIMHELTHYLVRQSPSIAPLEAHLATQERIGTITANYWNEIVATAFEHLARHTLSPRNSAQQALYGDWVIDTLARYLVEHWQQHHMQPLGPKLGDQLIVLMNQYWPEKYWTLKDAFFRVVVFAEDTPTLFAFRHASPGQALWGLAPLPTSFVRPENTPPSLSTLALTLDSTWRQRPEIPPTTLHDQQHANAGKGKQPILCWSYSTNDAPQAALIAATPESLHKTTKELARHLAQLPVPQEGCQPWSVNERHL